MKNKPKQGILIAFGELFLKSKGVKEELKQKLSENIQKILTKKEADFNIVNLRERIFIETKEIKKTKQIIKHTPGVTWSTEVIAFKEKDFEEVNYFIKTNYSSWIKNNESFALEVKKGDSKKSTQEIIEKAAENIKRKVNLDNPDKKIFIEKRKNYWFIYFKKNKAIGGLPIKTQGKVACLMSGGIDSPVASYLTLKRGAENIWIHFHSFPLTSKSSIEKNQRLAKIFLSYQPNLKLYLIPFTNIQKEIKTKTNPKYRVLLYRRMMLRIAKKIAEKENCQALVTGESLGQVSSQTLNNMQITQKSVNQLILRPLIGMNKEEIMNLAKRINTYEISIEPQEDCCTLFVPKKQTAEGKLEKVKKLEEELEINALINNSLKNMEIQSF